jgi:hypothetical protein
METSFILIVLSLINKLKVIIIIIYKNTAYYTLYM